VSAAPSIDELLRDLGAPGRSPELEVPSRVRAYVEAVREHLTTLHRKPDSGQIVNEANSDLSDRLVRRLFSLAEERVLADGGEIETGLVVVAVGGFARREMSIHSDVDLLVLYRNELSPYVTAVAERLQYWLWDAGLSVGCATRTIADTVAIGQEDDTVRTAVLTARFLCGDGEFFHEFADTIRGELLPDTEEFIRSRIENMHARHEQYGESLFLLQPNIKEGAGALRDYHTAFWVARGSQPTIRDHEDFLHFGLLTEPEMREYHSALEFLWRARNELHLLARRCDDQMSFELQEQVAEGLGYGSGASEDAELPVECFMRDYYRAARNIKNYSDLVIEQCMARTTRTTTGRDAREQQEVEDGFRLAAGQVVIPHAAHLRERPRRMISVFEVAQKYETPLSRMARRLLRENLDLIDDGFRRDPENGACFLGLLNGDHRVLRTLITMNEEGLLAAYLPEWEHIVCRWQHVIYHTYTVDVHSIFLVEELRRLWQGKYEALLPALTDLMRAAEDREVLYLGCLLHDIGKGFGGNHSAKGAARARPCVERLGMSPERVDRVVFLVEQHLLMSHLAQRRDLSDPKLILEFAQVCGDRTNLRNLYLMTFADIRASSRDAWTDWKGQLLGELFERTAEFLETGARDQAAAMEISERRVEVRRRGALAELRGLGVAESKIHSFFDAMPRRYFISHTPRQIARHAQVVLRFGGDQRVATAFRVMRGDFTEFILCVEDVHGLYSKVAGALTACGVNILGSHVYPSRTGFALEIYRVITPSGGREERELAWREFERVLEQVLSGEADVGELLARRGRPVGRTLPPSRMGASAIVSNAESEFYTIADVAANDRPGLLYDLTKTIARYGLSIYISKAATIRDQVTDTFYLKTDQSKKVTDADLIRRLQADLLVAARNGDEGHGG
jgi:[protein-PII] uridylyltransferase